MTNQQESLLQQIKDALASLRPELREKLTSFGLVLNPEKIEESYGGWLLPAELHASPIRRKSYELHRLITELEDELQDQTNATVTVSLHPA